MSVLKIRNENGEFVPFPEFQWAPIINTSATNSDIETYSCNYINQLNGVVLYENAAGTTGTIELNETSANFKYIEIYFGSGNDTYGYDHTKIPSPNGKTANLQLSTYTNGYQYNATMQAKIEGSTITNLQAYRFRINSSDGSITITENSTVLKIYEVVGYR